MSRRSFVKAAAIGAGLAATDVGFLRGIASGAANAISEENALAGSPGWDDIVPDGSIEGFPTEFSVNAGETIDFKIRTVSTDYRIDIYRIGWYGGLGARKVATVLPSATLPQSQPAPVVNVPLGLTECGNWAVSASWAVPVAAVSGVYVANLIRLDVVPPTKLNNRILFVVRNDGRGSDILLQTSDTTYQAYNRWGGNSLYYNTDGLATYGRAVKVSYNRPIASEELENEFFYAEVPLVRWLERNGFDVAYTSSIDTERRPAQLLTHKVFVSSGHDEYWSGTMRANVEAARDAGVNLVFMTGNELFWKVRWETATDGTLAPYKTLVCYKETQENAKVDPSPEWTGTWRDPRFSPPSNGGRPENALTGTLFKAINPTDATDFAIEVPAEYSQLRFWRNTSVTSLAPGTRATLTDATLGFEWNTDGDFPSRPKGLIRLSETTALANEVLTDYGKVYAPGSLTHYLTMYRAPSGALVWSTGTVQWSWGLDGYHTNRPVFTVPVDVRIQQATLNALADMGVEPATLQSGLVAATASTDTLPPVSSITSPVAGANVPIGTPVTITGTATDAGGGTVAAVEVSADGGVSWHPAIGRASWAYTWLPRTLGTVNLKVRAVDDSCNIEPDDAGTNITAVARSFPGSIWNEVVFPAIAATLDTTPLELGVKFTSAINGFITGIKFYKGTGNTGTHTGRLWSSVGVLLSTVEFTNETATGWQTVLFAVPVPINANEIYVASYSAPAGHYAADANYFASPYDLYPLTALGNSVSGGNGVFSVTPGAFPASAFGATNYWVDVVFDTDDAGAPTVAGTNPAPNVSQVAVATLVSATFNEGMNAGSVVFQLQGPSGAVTGSTSYDVATRTATFTPGAALAPLTSYTATIVTGTDIGGTAMLAPHSWAFTTCGAPGTVPTSIWTSADVPTVASYADTSPIELGLKFKAGVSGSATGIRFYKGTNNVGSHVGHLWTQAGVLLATVTFQNEGPTGWQEAAFAVPVEVSAGTTYVVSYYAPQGGYAADAGYFASADKVRGPLRGLAGPAAGGNGTFHYGAGGGFPTNTFSSTNYWVDVVFTRPPSLDVVSTTPAPGLQGVGIGTALSATYDQPINPANDTFTVAKSGGGSVPGTLTHDPTNVTATFQPTTALEHGAAYTATVNATSATGTPLTAPYSWSFTATTVVGASPATLWDTSASPVVPATNDTDPLELGVKFRADVDGVITAVRFYKGAGNTGTHIGHLWTSNGTLLGTVAFAAETQTGWQQANFASPIPITVGQTYVASYFSPTGNYSYTAAGLLAAVDRAPLHALANGVDGGNGVYAYGSGAFPGTSNNTGANYWVDVVFADTVGPTVTSRFPAANATQVGLETVVSATFSEAVQANIVGLQLRDGGGALVAGTTSYDAPTRTITFTPSAKLAAAAPYTASVISALDAAGNALQGPSSASFTTLTLPIEPRTGVPLVADATAPAVRLNPPSNDAPPT